MSSISAQIRLQVRVRANFRCEYCGVRERDAGGELTIDHYQPTSANGSDDMSNLVYCCSRCNLYKQDYWPKQPTAPALWNPRKTTADKHFLENNISHLYGLDDTGRFTITRLRLNRSQLIEYRQEQQILHELLSISEQSRLSSLTLENINRQLVEITLEQHQLLERQQHLIKLLLEE